MRKLLIILFCLLSFSVFSQNWDNNYPEVNVLSIIKSEKHYADSVEKYPEIIQYFTRFDKYSFKAEFLGQTREIDTSVLKSLKRVYKLFVGDPSQLDKLTNSEVLFKVGNEELWMPVQKNILSALKKEVKKGDKPKLYCAYFNEHTSQNKLYCTLLISEFVN